MVCWVKGIVTVFLILMSSSSYSAVDVQIIKAINIAAIKYQIDPKIIAAVIKIESDFDPFALSRKGAEGMMQIMPATQLELKLLHSFDSSENIDAGTRYLKQQLKRFGSIDKALWAYNAGATNVIRNIKPDETKLYIKRFHKYYSALIDAEIKLKAKL
ncbi:MAG: lytic transglycosylase domain-containing protein [Colwellia sp.]